MEAPSNHYSFIADGVLRPAPTVRHLLRPLRAVKADTLCREVMDRFVSDEALYALPVVNADYHPIALIDRKQFIEFFTKPYCREIFGDKRILDLLAFKSYKKASTIAVEDTSSIADVAKILLDAGVEQMVTGFLITNQGRYLGVANGHDLLNVITQRKQAELYHMAHYDSLTGVANRTLLNDRLEKACLLAQRQNALVALLFIDLDRFKRINDSLGHSAGDEVLCKVVERLKTAARRSDTVARLAGDEFVILMESLGDTADVKLVADRIVGLMRDPIEVHGHSLLVTVSIGSAIYPTDDPDMANLLTKADAAMYTAKATGRNGHRIYSEKTALHNPDTVLMASDLMRAIENSELVLHFQPRISLASNEFVGVEALVRWRHAELGLIPPGQFIPMAEECGLIVPLGETVLKLAVEQICEWRDSGLPTFLTSVNISAHQIYREGFAAFFRQLIQSNSIDAKCIELELTESVLMHHAGDVLATLEEIKRLGVHLAIDDFGTGFSSLSYLRRFPIDRLKIDQTFVRDIHNTPINASIARAIIALSGSLSLGITAEGIESEAERATLVAMGCSEGQGYLFGRPMASDELLNWIQSHVDAVEERPTLASHKRALQGHTV